jgi:hypothetical protein
MSLVVSPRPRDHAALGNLRAFVTVLVVLHHVVLAYYVGIPPAAPDWLTEPRWWKAVPVLDPRRSIAWTLVTGFNDVFFMALMFFLSGLFVWQSLERKRAAGFLRGRVHRLGWGFAAGAVLAPIAFYPAFAATGGHGLREYAAAWMQLGEWPSGPVWVLWLLLAFDAVAALVFTWGSASPWPFASPLAGRASALHAVSPARAFVLLASASCAAYLPMVAVVGPLDWSTFGPFTVQTSRLFHYAVYFAAGVIVGAGGVDRGWLAEGGTLARRAAWWGAGALAAFVVLTGLVVITPPTAATWQSLVLGATFTLSCAASSFALLALFLRAGASQSLAWRGLRDSAYGIFVVHFAVAAWIQYALVGWSMDPVIKGAVAFVLTLGISWTLASALRRMPGLRSVL